MIIEYMLILPIDLKYIFRFKLAKTNKVPGRFMIMLRLYSFLPVYSMYIIQMYLRIVKPESLLVWISNPHTNIPTLDHHGSRLIQKNWVRVYFVVAHGIRDIAAKLDRPVLSRC